MRWEHRVDIAEEAWDDLVARLGRRPATWLRPFLQLAASEARGSAERPRVWVRVGAPTPHPSARIWWRPHATEVVFHRFVGEIGLRRDDGRVWIWLEGRTEGGSPERNDRVIRSLLALLAAALAGVQDVG